MFGLGGGAITPISCFFFSGKADFGSIKSLSADFLEFCTDNPVVVAVALAVAFFTFCGTAHLMHKNRVINRLVQDKQQYTFANGISNEPESTSKRDADYETVFI